MQIERKEKIIFSKRKHKLFMLKHCFPKKSFNIQSPSYIVITNVVGHKNDNNNFLKHVTMLRVATLIKQSYLYQCTMQNQRGVVSILNMACILQCQKLFQGARFLAKCATEELKTFLIL